MRGAGPLPDGAARRRLALGALVVALAVAVAAADPLHRALLGSVDLLEPLMARQPVVAAALFVGLAALSAMLAFFSSAVLVPVVLEAWGAPASAALLWVGWTLGGMGAYALARTLGRPVVRRFVPSDALARYEATLSARTPFGVVLLFQLALPSEVPGYVLGLARYPFGRYVLALGLAELPFAAATVAAGAGLLERRVPVIVGLAAAAALLSGGALVALRRWRRRTDGPAPGTPPPPEAGADPT